LIICYHNISPFADIVSEIANFCTTLYGGSKSASTKRFVIDKFLLASLLYLLPKRRSQEAFWAEIHESRFNFSEHSVITLNTDINCGFFTRQKAQFVTVRSIAP